jgi:hypothetical protein
LEEIAVIFEGKDAVVKNEAPRILEKGILKVQMNRPRR